MRIYVAGTRHDPRIEDGSLVATLRARGHTIVSRWHDEGCWRPETQQSEDDRRDIAMMNFGDIDRCDAVLAVPYPGHHLCGAHVEIGYGLGTGREVYILGGPRAFNTMTAHVRVRYLGNLDELPR